MEVYYFFAGALAAWAVLIAFLGIARERFPASKRSERLVAAVSVLLVAGTIGAAIVGGASERAKKRSEAAALAPRA